MAEQKRLRAIVDGWLEKIVIPADGSEIVYPPRTKQEADRQLLPTRSRPSIAPWHGPVLPSRSTARIRRTLTLIHQVKVPHLCDGESMHHESHDIRAAQALRVEHAPLVHQPAKQITLPFC